MASRTKSAENVLKVPNAALRFRPANATATTTAPTTTTAPVQARKGSFASLRTKGGTLYVLDAKGNPQPVKVQTGITDGTTTEVRGDGVKEGMPVIAGAAGTQQQQTASTNATPFQSGQQAGGQRGGRGGF